MSCTFSRGDIDCAKGNLLAEQRNAAAPAPPAVSKVRVRQTQGERERERERGRERGREGGRD